MTTPKRPPWVGAASRAAGLPRERQAWLDAVLPAIRATSTHPRTVALLREHGYDLGAAGAPTVARWCAWINAHAATLELDPLPPRQIGRAHV